MGLFLCIGRGTKLQVGWAFLYNDGEDQEGSELGFTVGVGLRSVLACGALDDGRSYNVTAALAGLDKPCTAEQLPAFIRLQTKKAT